MNEDETPNPVVGDQVGSPTTDLAGSQDPTAPGDRLVAANPLATYPVKASSGVEFDTAQLPRLAIDPPIEPWEGDEDLVDDEGEERRSRAETNRRARRITAALALVAAIGIGFASGVLFQKHQGGTTGANASSFASLFRSRGGAAGAFAGFSGAGGSSAASGTVTGTVSAISGGTLYISGGSSSALTKVVTVPTSTITVPSPGTVTDIHPGDSVVVRGAQQTDGSFVAGTITDTGVGTATGAVGALTSGG